MIKQLLFLYLVQYCLADGILSCGYFSNEKCFVEPYQWETSPNDAFTLTTTKVYNWPFSFTVFGITYPEGKIIIITP